ncbi:MAG: Solvent efflux pump outer membrane protein SrpC [Herbaspirillum frisingense]|uniref:Solvent efflux pump outer membrane protein SrpC n=1 Tax=Herbaspirillum frisingense TaxID=92645 RepID=A0A7V8FXA7_9BURK|nr:MAG: Solvent efflux pump outer membrane protein SrpC [Herbaspirillum frisingense]
MSVNYLGNDYLTGNRTFSFSLGPLISWSFPNMAVARSRVAQANAQSAADLAGFDGAVLNALKESEQSLSAYGAGLERRAALTEAERRAGNAFRLADQRYATGAVSYLDVLTAQTELLNARAALTTAEQQLGSARVDVFKALGGGWEDAAAAR